MQMSPRGLSSYASAFVAAMLLASCDSSGGPTTVHFSMSNYDGCVVAALDVDLDEVKARVARKPDGTADCEISASLGQRGCRMTIQEQGSDENGTLFVEIDECQVGSITEMFSCRFLEADLDFLNLEASDCGCLTHHDSCYTNGICDVCAVGSPGRKGCEDCDNGADDDGDSHTDCDDNDCELTQDCGFGRTTITCTDSTETTFTTLTTSTTSEPLLQSLPDTRFDEQISAD